MRRPFPRYAAFRANFPRDANNQAIVPPDAPPAPAPPAAVAAAVAPALQLQATYPGGIPAVQMPLGGQLAPQYAPQLQQPAVQLPTSGVGILPHSGPL